MNNINKLAASVLLAMSLAACGGGGGGNSNSGTSNPTPPVKPTDPIVPPVKPTDPIVPPVKPTDPIVPPVKPTDPIVPPVKPTDPIVPPTAESDAQIALATNNTLSLKRSECGFGGLDYNEELTKAATAHNNYLKYVQENSVRLVIDPHTEATYKGYETITGPSNPYYKGYSAFDRINATNYKNKSYGVFENIAGRVEYGGTASTRSPQEIADILLKSLLAAPYHARSLLDRRAIDSGMGFATFRPMGDYPSIPRGYTLTAKGGVGSPTDNNPRASKGIATYPCDGQVGLATGLFNESPNPFGNTRNLAANPIGQSVYITNNSAVKMTVSNVVFTDTDREINIPVKILDSTNNPHQATGTDMRDNEAFIMPLTDSMKSCKDKSSNCGLFPSTNHAVSFDVVSDGTLVRKTIKFKTGLSDR